MAEFVMQPQAKQESVDEVNSKICIYNFGIVSSISALQTALNTKINSMPEHSIQNFRVQCYPQFDYFQGIFLGTIHKYENGRAYLTMHNASNVDVEGSYNDSAWAWNSLNSNITAKVNEKIQSVGYNVDVSSFINLETKINTFDITKTGYTPISAIVVGSWDEPQWVHTIRFNSSLTSMDVKSLHIGTSGSSISFAVRVAYRKND